MEYIWMKVTNDEFELPVAVASTAEELGSIVGVSPNTIFSAISHAEQRGKFSIYQRVKFKKGK